MRARPRCRLRRHQRRRDARAERPRRVEASRGGARRPGRLGLACHLHPPGWKGGQAGPVRAGSETAVRVDPTPRPSMRGCKFFFGRPHYAHANPPRQSRCCCQIPEFGACGRGIAAKQRHADLDDEAALDTVATHLATHLWSPTDRVRLAFAFHMRFSTVSTDTAFRRILELTWQVDREEQNYIAALILGLSGRQLSPNQPLKCWRCWK